MRFSLDRFSDIQNNFVKKKLKIKRYHKNMVKIIGLMQYKTYNMLKKSIIYIWNMN